MKRHGPEELPSDEEPLWAWAEAQRSPDEENTIRKAFESFHAAHPEVYALFERFALEGIAVGMELLGAGAVWERMRWETAVGTRAPDGTKYRLNNNYRAYYAREFMARHPEYPEVFATRKVRS